MSAEMAGLDLGNEGAISLRQEFPLSFLFLIRNPALIWQAAIVVGIVMTAYNTTLFRFFFLEVMPVTKNRIICFGIEQFYQSLSFSEQQYNKQQRKIINHVI